MDEVERLRAQVADLQRRLAAQGAAALLGVIAGGWVLALAIRSDVVVAGRSVGEIVLLTLLASSGVWSVVWVGLLMWWGW